MCPKPKVVVSITKDALHELTRLIHHPPPHNQSWRHHVEVGDRVDALFWPTGLWLRATVVDMDHRYVPSRRFLKLTYHGLSETFDIWTSRTASK